MLLPVADSRNFLPSFSQLLRYMETPSWKKRRLCGACMADSLTIRLPHLVKRHIMHNSYLSDTIIIQVEPHDSDRQRWTYNKPWQGSITKFLEGITISIRRWKLWYTFYIFRIKARCCERWVQTRRLTHDIWISRNVLLKFVRGSS